MFSSPRSPSALKHGSIELRGRLGTRLPWSARRALRLLPAVAIVSVLGCGGAGSADERLARAITESGVQKIAVFPLAGKVTVDGEAPNGAGVVVVMLSDAAKPDTPLALRRRALCERDGSFVFSTYKYGDGVPEADYLVTMVQRSRTGSLIIGGPDGFRNLYSDPRTSEFRIEHRRPGRTDHEFDLRIAGR